jgi:hypothetical protein
MDGGLKRSSTLYGKGVASQDAQILGKKGYHSIPCLVKKEAQQVSTRYGPRVHFSLWQFVKAKEDATH